MNREEKNQQTRRRILDGALAEFAKQGYGGSSLNSICASQGISKGIIYHYFRTKDALYLSCVEECFQKLTDYLRGAFPMENKDTEAQLEQYFSVRMAFFQENPVFQPIFCEAVISPPKHLEAEIRLCRRSFDALTEDILTQLLQPLPLRPHITMEEVVETFREFQDFINANYQSSPLPPAEFQKRDARCRRALNILLYGVIERSKP